jgi:hypothetical protein
MTYRNDVDALTARADALANEVRTKQNELATTRVLLEEAKAKARLPVLPNIRIASPCSMDWNAMTGDERVRSCAACNKQVFNLSALTRQEAEALIVEKAGDLCANYYQRKDGTILLADCSIGIRQKRTGRVLAAGIVALLGGAAVAGFGLDNLTRPATDPMVHEYEDTDRMGGAISFEQSDKSIDPGLLEGNSDQPAPTLEKL